MTTIRPIYELQEMDSKIDRQQSELATVEARLADNKLMEELKRRLSTNEERLMRLMQTKSSQAMQDLEAKQFQAKVQSLEERLYGGSVRNQKELESITSELQYTKQQYTESDEQLLTLMLSVDELEKQIAETRARIKELESTQAEARVKLAGERDALKESLASDAEKRTRMVEAIPALLLSQYERLRKAKQGVAVAMVQGGRCMACRLALPTGEMQSLRTSNVPITCSSCGRILYTS